MTEFQTTQNIPEPTFGDSIFEAFSCLPKVLSETYQRRNLEITRQWILHFLGCLLFLLLHTVYLLLPDNIRDNEILHLVLLSVTLTLYYHWLLMFLNRESYFCLKFIKPSRALFRMVVLVAFCDYLVKNVTWFLFGTYLPGLYYALHATIFILLNPLAEIIYLRAGRDYTVLKDSFGFFKKNWVHWLVFFSPLLILPSFVLGTGWITATFAESSLINPLSLFDGAYRPDGQLLPGLMPFTFMGALVTICLSGVMTYRASFFLVLDKSNPTASPSQPTTPESL